MRTLIIGGGYLAQKFISYAKEAGETGNIDVITRSQQRKETIEALGCRHYCEDLSRPQFKLPKNAYDSSLGGYDRVLLNAAVTVDRRVHSSKKRLYVDGTHHLFRELHKIGFTGKVILIGSTSALPTITHSTRQYYKIPFTEDVLESLHQSSHQYPGLTIPEDSPSYQQYAFWRQLYSEQTPPSFSSTFLMSSGIYGADRHPADRLARGLRVTNKNPEQWINFIHANDLVRCIHFFFKKHLSQSDCYFVSNNSPITLHEYYKEYCKWQGLPAVSFQPETRLDSLGKCISSQKLLATGFQLQHPSVLDSFSHSKLSSKNL